MGVLIRVIISYEFLLICYLLHYLQLSSPVSMKSSLPVKIAYPPTTVYHSVVPPSDRQPPKNRSRGSKNNDINSVNQTKEDDKQGTDASLSNNARRQRKSRLQQTLNSTKTKSQVLKNINRAKKRKIAAKIRKTQAAVLKARADARIRMQKLRQQTLSDIDDNRITFESETIEKKHNFHNFESFPETSALLYHLNSGHAKFRDILALQLYQGDTNMMEKDPAYIRLVAEINDEILTEEEADTILQRFLQSHGKFVPQVNEPKSNQTLSGIPKSIEAPHLCCGMCGIKTVQGRYNQFCETVYLDDLPDEITLQGKKLQSYLALQQKPPLMLPINDNGDLAEFDLHQLISVYYSPTLQKYFHLHPELIHESTDQHDHQSKEQTVLCPKCLRVVQKQNNYIR